MRGSVASAATCLAFNTVQEVASFSLFFSHTPSSIVCVCVNMVYVLERLYMLSLFPINLLPHSWWMARAARLRGGESALSLSLYLSDAAALQHLNEGWCSEGETA